MATHVYCDHKDHESDGGRITPAVAAVRVTKRDEKTSSILNTTKGYDSCMEHIGHFAGDAYRLNHKDPLFERIVVDKLT